MQKLRPVLMEGAVAHQASPTALQPLLVSPRKFPLDQQLEWVLSL